MKKATCIDIFCGAGGLSLGLTSAGFDVLYAFDKDPVCISTRKANVKYFNHPSEDVDIVNEQGEDILNKLHMHPGDLDLLAGGPPCQGFSIQRIGSDKDGRNRLVESYLKLVNALKPKVFIMENVPGITGRRGKLYLENFVKKAQNYGYKIHTKILDAQDFGVPQRRRRYFIVGTDKKLGLNFSFPGPTTTDDSRLTVRAVIGSLPQPPMDGSEHPEYPHHKRDRLSSLNMKRLEFLKEGQSRIHLPDSLLPPCHKISAEKIGHRNVYGRMRWDSVAPTITARFDSFTRGMFGHPDQNRSISLLEGSMLQGFPGDMRFCGTKVEIARQIGNAVPVNLSKEVGNSLLKCIGAY